MFAEDAGALRSLTLGGWHALVRQHGWADARVWTHLSRSAEAALPAVRRRLRRGEADELLSDVLVLAREPPVSWRRAEVENAPLVSWLGGVMKRLLVARRRAQLPTIGALVDQLRSANSQPRRGPTSPRIDAASLLTAKQLAAWELACRGLGSRLAARELGITRDAFRDRLRRAKLRIATATPAPSRHDPMALAQMAKHVAVHGTSSKAALLVLRSVGTSYRACAASLGLTLEAVRSRVRRMWRTWKASLAPTRGATAPPCSALLLEKRRGSSATSSAIARSTRSDAPQPGDVPSDASRPTSDGPQPPGGASRRTGASCRGDP